MTGNSIPGTRTQSRVISLEEANNMLPLLGKIVGDITAAWEQIIQKRTELECLEKNPESNGSEHREEISELKSDLNRLISGGAGVLFKGSGFYETDYRSASYESGAKQAKQAEQPSPPCAKGACTPDNCSAPE